LKCKYNGRVTVKLKIGVKAEVKVSLKVKKTCGKEKLMKLRLMKK
jgi:hypothetical protein